MVRGTTSRMIFVDSTVNTHHDRTLISLPPHPFSVVGNERAAFSLQQFSIRRNWYNINPTNNTGYLYIDGTHHEFQIAPGLYSTFNDLSVAIKAALTACVTANNLTAKIQLIECTPIDSTRQFQIVVTMAAGQTSKVEIRCFHIRPGATAPAGVTPQGGFSDIHEILGGKPLRSDTDDFESLKNANAAGGNSQTITSQYPASLNTLSAIYLHLTAFETGNFMSTSHESQAQDSIRLIESSLFARIPIARSTFSEVHEVVEYVDHGNDTFQSFPLRKNFDQMELRICDSKGRSLAALDQFQAENGLMGWQAVIRFDVFRPPANPQEGKRAGGLHCHHPPEL